MVPRVPLELKDRVDLMGPLDPLVGQGRKDLVVSTVPQDHLEGLEQKGRADLMGPQDPLAEQDHKDLVVLTGPQDPLEGLVRVD